MRSTGLKAYCHALEFKLQMLPGISLVDIEGFSESQLKIELSGPALLLHELSASDVVESIKRQSINSPVGTIETSQREILLRFIEQRCTAKELESLVIMSKKGGGRGFP